MTTFFSVIGVVAIMVFAASAAPADVDLAFERFLSAPDRSAAGRLVNESLGTEIVYHPQPG